MPAAFYQALQISETATQQQIKQAYKRLALKYHPDKNTDKQSSTVKFRQISEAYSVLNDPQKRQNYDKYGTADLDFEGMGFEDFMGDFGAFEDFLEEVLAFNDFEAMFKEMNKKSKRKGKARGRGKGRGKGSRNDLLSSMGKLNGKGMPSMEEMMEMMGGMGGIGMDGKLLEEALLEAFMQGEDIDLADLMGGLDEQAMEKQLQKMMFGEDEDDDSEDEQDLTEEQQNILEFGQKNITRKRVGNKKKKKQLRCNFDNQKIKQEEILLHFSEKHMKEFREYQANGKDNSNNNTGKTESNAHKEEQDIQY